MQAKYDCKNMEVFSQIYKNIGKIIRNLSKYIKTYFCKKRENKKDINTENKKNKEGICYVYYCRSGKSGQGISEYAS